MILICDNAPYHIGWLTDYLGTDEVTISENLFDSLENLKENAYDIVLINLDMPSGQSILRLARVMNYLTTEVIGYTEYYNSDIAAQAKQFKYGTTSRPYDFKRIIADSILKLPE